MQARAVLRGFRMSPTKVRLVADLVRGKRVDEALAILRNMPHKAAREIYRTVASAAANAENNFQMDRDDLVIKTIMVDEGPALKRYMPRARGRVNVIRKRSSHITVIVDDGQEY
ncbi:50S ribosomal protein L22 [Kallotenue papyrolyticum]|uniref:50S ribosomal protein L22 n=1 Tax=Kallotenue papyrolyticum TaxID=1325125 RepID=UPI0004785BB0|nr:50S ribosomal protein L22 [Kallotenue papyrolyticum]